MSPLWASALRRSSQGLTSRPLPHRLCIGPAKIEAAAPTIPLPKVTRRVLSEHRDRQDRERAEIPGVRLHDLRHTVVSLLLDLGTPPHVVQAIARHADIDVTMTIYAHTNLDAMRQALDVIDWENLRAPLMLSLCSDPPLDTFTTHHHRRWGREPARGIEPRTFRLQGECSAD
jgi:integrase